MNEITKPQGLTPLEDRWYEGLPDSFKRIISEHGLELFHFTLNRAMIQEELSIMSQRIKAQDAQARLRRIAMAVNVIIQLLEKSAGITKEAHDACLKDVEIASSLGAGQESRIIIPDGAQRH